MVATGATIGTRGVRYTASETRKSLSAIRRHFVSVRTYVFTTTRFAEYRT